MNTGKNRVLLSVAFILLVVTCMALKSGYLTAQSGSPTPAGNSSGLAVQVVNVPLPVSAAQSGTWNVGITGTPTVKTGTPFYQSSIPTCDVINRCAVTFPAVPANKRLRVTHIHGIFLFQSADAFASLDLDTLSHPVFALPVVRFGGAYIGNLLSFNEETNVIFEAGQTPILEIGTTGSFFSDSRNRLGITGELIDVS